MRFLHKRPAGPDTALRHKEALQRLDWMKRASVPSFHACGIVNADIGYYQLAKLEDGKRLLVFALNLEDLQLKEVPGAGILFAHTDKLYGVNAYDAKGSKAEIYQDMMNHQTALQQAMLDDYTLVHTDDDIYQSRSVSYAVTQASVTDNRKHVESIIDALHNTELAAANAKPGLYASIRYPRVRLTNGSPLESKGVVPRILEDFAGMLDRLMSGKEGLQLENTALNLRSRLSLRAKIYLARLADNVGGAVHDNLHEWGEKKVSTSVEWFKRVWALAKIPMVFHESVIELGLSLWEALGVSFSGKPSPERPKALAPYVRPLGLYTRLNAHLHPLRMEALRTAIPLTMEEAQINPVNVQVKKTNPFTPSNVHPPALGSIRAPMGTILFALPCTSLMLQANGIWLAHNHDRKKTYVGYNKALDTSSNPKPSPILSSWLDQGKILCYSENGGGGLVQPANLEEAQEALKELYACECGQLLNTDKPEHPTEPYVIPCRPPTVEFNIGARVIKDKAAQNITPTPDVA